MAAPALSAADDRALAIELRVVDQAMVQADAMLGKDRNGSVLVV